MGRQARAKFTDGVLSIAIDNKIWCAQMGAPSVIEARDVQIIFRSGTSEQEIHRFEKRAQAEAALGTIAEALTAESRKRRSFFGRLFTVTLVFIAVLGVLLLVSRVTSREHEPAPQPTSQIEQKQEEQEPRAGVPVPAEELLGK